MVNRERLTTVLFLDISWMYYYRDSFRALIISEFNCRKSIPSGQIQAIQTNLLSELCRHWNALCMAYDDCTPSSARGVWADHDSGRGRYDDHRMRTLIIAHTLIEFSLKSTMLYSRVCYGCLLGHNSFFPVRELRVSKGIDGTGVVPLSVNVPCLRFLIANTSSRTSISACDAETTWTGCRVMNGLGCRCGWK